MRQLAAAGPVAARRVIMVKGYQGWAGRAQDALESVAMCGDLLRGYEVVVYAASPAVAQQAQRLRVDSGLNIRIVPRRPHGEILELFGRARIAIGVNITDGVPNAMLEAMTMGAFPIQSDTESTAEWISHGENGLLVEPGNPQQIADAIRRALLDDALVDSAARRNASIIRERLELSAVRTKVIDMYTQVAATGKPAAS
jgi:glycosyltransferase involved in cell wall biosynthesis